MPIRIIRPIFTFRRTQDQASSWSVFLEHLNGARADDAWRSVVDAWIGGSLVQWLEGQQLYHCAEAVKKLECKKNDAVENQQSLASALFGEAWPNGVKKTIEQEEIARRLALDEKYQAEQRLLAEKKRQEEMRLEEERRREEQRRHGMAIPGEDWTAELPGGVKLEMVWVEPGTFLKGCLFNDYDEQDLENICEVTFSKGYWIGKYQVTQEQYEAVGLKNLRWKWKRARLPVTNVSFEDAIKYCEKINKIFIGKIPDDYKIHLPTGSQWEFAARGGVKTNNFLYSGSNNLYDVAWYKENSCGRPHDVGLKKANELGIYDMSGNVWEWSNEWSERYSKERYWKGRLVDPQGPEDKYDRSINYYGGSFDDGCSVTTFTSSSGRCCWPSGYPNYPPTQSEYVGFRVALVPVQ